MGENACRVKMSLGLSDLSTKIHIVCPIRFSAVSDQSPGGSTAAAFLNGSFFLMDASADLLCGFPPRFYLRQTYQACRKARVSVALFGSITVRVQENTAASGTELCASGLTVSGFVCIMRTRSRRL
jgi:hypothetical protein